jgi:hypothetical protein
MVGGIASFALAAYIFNNLWIGTLFPFIGADKWIDGHLGLLEPREIK